MNKKTSVREISIAKIIAFVFVAIYCLLLIVALVWAILTSLKGEYDFYGMAYEGVPNRLGFPRKWTFENYVTAFERGFYVDLGRDGEVNFFLMMLYSLLYAGGCTLVSLAGKVLTAYAVAKYKFPGRRFLYVASVITMILPIVGSMPSILRVMRMLNLYNTFIGVFLLNGGFHGLYFLLFYSAFVSVPDSYLEAARIDGAGHFKVLFKVVLPLVIPTVIAIGVMQFIAFWNGYEQPMMYLGSRPTISYGLFRMINTGGQNAYDVPQQLAAALIVCLPILIVFIIFRNKIMNNMSVGGIKG